MQSGFAALKTASSQHIDITNQTLPGLNYNDTVFMSRGWVKIDSQAAIMPIFYIVT